jgi:hypothetical protein
MSRTGMETEPLHRHLPGKIRSDIIRLQNGTTYSERVERMEFVNGVDAVRNDKYAYPFIAVITRLKMRILLNR